MSTLHLHILYKAWREGKKGSILKFLGLQQLNTNEKKKSIQSVVIKFITTYYKHAITPYNAESIGLTLN